MADGERGVLVNCHAGCPTESVCAAVGLTVADLAHDSPPAARERSAAYEYQDEEGRMLFRVIRYRPKGFAQQAADGSWSLKNVRRVPYRLPEVIRAASEGRAVWIVEGEKDADALARLGFAATCNPMGEGKWLDEYSSYLRGCAWALIVPDCDSVGREHAQKVAVSLKAAGVRSKVVDLGRDDGYDVSDFLIEHGEDADRMLRDLARTTPQWTPREKRKLLPATRVADFLARIPPYDEALDYLGPFLHGGYRVHVAGPIGHGKTSFLLEAVSAAVRGDDFLGFPGRGGLRCIYVDLEMPAELIGQAVRDARLEEADGFHLVSLPDGLRIDSEPEDARMLEETVAELDPHLLVLDPWYKLMEQELDYSANRAIVACIDGIRTRHRRLCTLVGFHAQEPPTPKQPLLMASISGFKYFQRPADVVLTLQRIEGDTSRLRWLKNRSPRLAVRMGEMWTVEWTRGSGFRRVEGEQRFAPQDEEEDALFG